MIDLKDFIIESANDAAIKKIQARIKLGKPFMVVGEDAANGITMAADQIQAKIVEADDIADGSSDLVKQLAKLNKDKFILVINVTDAKDDELNAIMPTVLSKDIDGETYDNMIVALAAGHDVKLSGPFLSRVKPIIKL